MVLGVSATIRQLPFAGVTVVDLAVMTGSALLFWLFGWFIRTRTITRGEGAVMTMCYLAYVGWLIYQAV